MHYQRHDIVLRDIRDGELVVTYVCINDTNTSHTEGRHVSARLPVECLVLLDDGTVDVTDLSADERAWVRTASAERSNEIDFAGTETGPEVAA